MSPRKLAIEYLPVASLRPDPKNPRLHDDKQVQQIARSIKTFGLNVPVLVDARLHVIAGHGRLLACKLLGITQVPAIRLKYLSEHQKRAFMIADNRLNENSMWDDRLLGQQLKILSAAELDFNLEVTGFEMTEIDLFIENFSPATEGGVDPADAITDSQARPQVTRAGDCWILGRHRVYCGDARNDSDYSALMQGRRAEMVFTSPPYNIAIDGDGSEVGEVHHAESALASGENSASESTDFLTNVVTRLARHSVDGALQYICMDWRHSAELLAAACSAYTEFASLCIWAKDRAEQGSLYRSQHELIFVFKVGKKPHRNNKQRGKYGRYRTNVWSYRHVNSQSEARDKGSLSRPHRTIKPVELVADAILDCTSRGDVVLDPFSGSGTTLVAAERTGRVCYGIELNPHDVDTIVRRWQAFTGHSAVQQSTGRTFNDAEGESHERA